MIVKIAVCDDNEEDIEMIKGTMKHIVPSKDVEIYADYFKNAQRLYESVCNKDYDAVFLDIEMPGTDGLQLADRLREKFPYLNIIFVTNRSDMVFNTLKFMPFGFVRKISLRKEMDDTFTRLLDKIKKESFICSFNDGIEHKIHIREIFVIEASGHEVVVYLEKDTKKMNGLLGSFEKRLRVYNFVRVHKGYIVNLKHVYAFDTHRIIMSNKIEIPVGKKYLNDIKELYTNFRSKAVNGDI